MQQSKCMLSATRLFVGALFLGAVILAVNLRNLANCSGAFTFSI